MIDGTQELSEIIREMRYRVLEDNGLTVNGLITIEQETKQAIIDWHNKQIEEVLDRLKAGISADIPNYYDQDGWEVAMKHIQAERAKLKEVK